MNPNLRIFFKRSVYVLVLAALVATMFYGVTNLTDIDLSAIGSYFMSGFVAVMVTGMSVLIIGFLLRVVWTGIMNRVDSITMCCPDKKHDGVHIVASHYNAGGESTDGFNSYFHYYLDDNGKLYLSKKVEKEGDDISKSLVHLSKQTRLQLDPDLKRAVRIGSNTDGDNNATDVTMKVGKGELRFRGYDGLMDYGFKVSYSVGGLVRWSVKL